MQNLYLYSANHRGVGAFTCLLHRGRSGEENLGVVVSSRVIMSWQQQWDYRCRAQLIFSGGQENSINNASI